MKEKKKKPAEYLCTIPYTAHGLRRCLHRWMTLSGTLHSNGSLLLACLLNGHRTSSKEKRNLKIAFYFHVHKNDFGNRTRRNTPYWLNHQIGETTEELSTW